LGRFWADFGQILGRFWADFGQILSAQQRPVFRITMFVFISPLFSFFWVLPENQLHYKNYKNYKNYDDLRENIGGGGLPNEGLLKKEQNFATKLLKNRVPSTAIC
jgi:hypothetical protein